MRSPPGGHQVVPCPLRRGPRQHRCLHLNEAMLVLQEAADAAHDGVAQAQVVCHLGAAAGVTWGSNGGHQWVVWGGVGWCGWQGVQRQA